MTWSHCRAIGLRRFAVIALVNIAYASTSNGASASDGRLLHRDRSMSKSSTTIEDTMPRSAIHPGEQLAEELAALGLSAAELARQLAVPTNRITAILNGQRGISADTALRLGHWFGTSPEFWLNLQAIYDLRNAEQAVGETIEKLPRRMTAAAE
jgi:addiction module HigA family antidote